MSLTREALGAELWQALHSARALGDGTQERRLLLDAVVTLTLTDGAAAAAVAEEVAERAHAEGDHRSHAKAAEHLARLGRDPQGWWQRASSAWRAADDSAASITAASHAVAVGPFDGTGVDQALAVVREARDHGLQGPLARAFYAIGHHRLAAGDASAAVGAWNHALEQATGSARDVQVLAAFHLGLRASEAGGPAAAASHFESARRAMARLSPTERLGPISLIQTRLRAATMVNDSLRHGVLNQEDAERLGHRLQELGQLVELARLELARGRVALAQGELQLAAERFDAAGEAAGGGTGDPEAEIAAAYGLCQALVRSGRIIEAGSAIRHAVALAEPRGGHELRVCLLQALQIARGLGQPGLTIRWLDRLETLEAAEGQAGQARDWAVELAQVAFRTRDEGATERATGACVRIMAEPPGDWTPARWRDVLEDLTMAGAHNGVSEVLASVQRSLPAEAFLDIAEPCARLAARSLEDGLPGPARLVGFVGEAAQALDPERGGAILALLNPTNRDRS